MTVDDLPRCIAPRSIAGLQLRYFLTLHLFDAGESSIGDLVGAVERQGFSLDAPGSADARLRCSSSIGWCLACAGWSLATTSRAGLI
jgi:hypothetical protein